MKSIKAPIECKINRTMDSYSRLVLLLDNLCANCTDLDYVFSTNRAYLLLSSSSTNIEYITQALCKNMYIFDIKLSKKIMRVEINYLISDTNS